ALVGADITGDIARPQVPPDGFELGALIAKQGLQRPGPKPDTFGGKPSLENRHRSAFSFCDIPRSAWAGICEHANPAWRSGPSTLSLRSSYPGMACRAAARAPRARLRPAGSGAAALLASRAKAGGGRRTRTFEVIRRLIYSQLPLPLGTLPRSTASQPTRRNGGDKAMDDVKTKDPITGSRLGAFMAESRRQSQPTPAANTWPRATQIAIIRNP
ncbi:MAG: hypothetical protein QOI87_327, partial [Bradyrhizobium sp.]|nr:hypothetical protein [Bradyrhizobium sp.]